LSGRKYDDTPNPDPRFAGEWFLPPKDFTMFIVKYINEYQGVYFQWGTSTTRNSIGTTLDSTYQHRWVEFNPTVSLVTSGRNTVEGSFILKSKSFVGTVRMEFDFSGAYNGTNNCTIRGQGTTANFTYTVTGTGKFTNSAAGTYNGFGNKDRNGITLSYTVEVATNGGETYTYTAQDELVLRSRDIVMEIYEPGKI